MSNFWARTITGLSMVFLLLAALFFSGWIFAVTFLLITVAGLWEFYGLVTTESCQPLRWYGTFSGALLYISVTLYFFLDLAQATDPLLKYLPWITTLALFFTTFILEIYRKKTAPLTNIAMTALGLFYVALPFSLLNAFSSHANLQIYGIPQFLTGYFILTWFYDTAAYLYGKQFGRHKFFERISPKKTWEGTLAGVIVAFLTAYGLSRIPGGISPMNWMILAIMVVFFGTYGDLVESMIKRGLNVKDSGTILPGHGGILDRFDTILISSPFVFLYFYLLDVI